MTANKQRRTLEEKMEGKIKDHLLNFVFDGDKQAYNKYNKECRKYVQVLKVLKSPNEPDGLCLNIRLDNASLTIAQEARKRKIGKLSNINLHSDEKANVFYHVYLRYLERSAAHEHIRHRAASKFLRGAAIAEELGWFGEAKDLSLKALSKYECLKWWESEKQYTNYFYLKNKIKQYDRILNACTPRF